jgi:lambda family phage portal protein
MSNAIDRLVGYFSPDAGLRRHRSRQLLQRAYEGASRKDGWKPRRAGASPNADVRADAYELCVRARSLVQNTPYMAQGLRFKTAQHVGTGIKPKSKAKKDADREVLDQKWLEMESLYDADGRKTTYGLQGSAYRAMDQDGEVLVRIRYRRPGDGLPVPLQFQLLERDWIDSTKTMANGGNQIINGIEYDALGKVAGYWLYDTHPGEINTFAPRGWASRFVPAESVIHLFNPERPGQGRGFSAMGPVITRVRDLQLYEDAEIARKNMESRLGVLASGDATTMANNPVDISQPGDPAAAKQTGDLGILPSGGMTQLPDGVNVTVVEPRAVPGYTDYVVQQLFLIAAGYGATYEGMTGDASRSNFSGSRSRMIDFRREVEMMQWLTLIPMLCNRMWGAHVDACYLAGLISKRDYTVEWSTPKWEYVNPEQDVKADTAEISAGLSSLSEKLRRRGYDPESVFAEIASDFKTLQGLGVLDILMFLQKGSAPDGAAQADQAKTSARMLEDITKVLDRMDQRLASVEQRATTVTLQAGDTNVSVPERSVTVEAAQVHVDVAAPPAPDVKVEIRNEGAQVNVPAQAAPEVHVAAPEVRITNQVETPTVTVEVPTRTVVTEVERDAQNRITRTIQRET